MIVHRLSVIDKDNRRLREHLSQLRTSRHQSQLSFSSSVSSAAVKSSEKFVTGKRSVAGEYDCCLVIDWQMFVITLLKCFYIECILVFLSLSMFVLT